MRQKRFIEHPRRERLGRGSRRATSILSCESFVHAVVKSTTASRAICECTASFFLLICGTSNLLAVSLDALSGVTQTHLKQRQERLRGPPNADCVKPRQRSHNAVIDALNLPEKDAASPKRELIFICHAMLVPSLPAREGRRNMYMRQSSDLNCQSTHLQYAGDHRRQDLDLE